MNNRSNNSEYIPTLSDVDNFSEIDRHSINKLELQKESMGSSIVNFGGNARLKVGIQYNSMAESFFGKKRPNN